MRVLKGFCFFIAIVFILSSSVTYASVVLDKALDTDVQASIERGVKWIQEHQDKGGSFGNHAGITALVATALMRSPKHYTESNNQYVKDAISFIISKAQDDGSISDRGPAGYTTSVAIMALVETKNPKYKDIISKAQKYLIDLQLDEADGITPDNKMYGGFGYSKDNTNARGDMSNLHFSLEALQASGVSKDAEVWKKAIKFIERCQNRSESNDQSWATDDGGFIYHPAPESERASKSYGSMTYAGIESFIYANVDKKDPRVQDAVKWIQNNYTVDENPPIGSNGLYYYYHTMAKAFAVYGEQKITDSKGTEHNWYADLARKLISLQKADGSWANEADRWMESLPVLTTAYSVLALSVAYNK